MNNDILNKSLSRAFGGGISGFSAMFIQVSSLMWLRTTMNYQYSNGGTFKNTLSKLYNEGGIKRFYKGYPPAIIIGPLARFGDTAANSFATTYLQQYNQPLYIQTLFGSTLASGWRISLMPLDSLKTTLQVHGNNGLNNLKLKIKNNGIRGLYHGSLANMSATFVGHYPWFFTYNYLNNYLPKYEENYKNIIRNGFIGFNAAIISDCSSNSLRVIKTSKQTDINSNNYKNTIKNIIDKDGYCGLFGRGLKTRIITNGLQGILFNITWKYIEKEYFNNKEKLVSNNNKKYSPNSYK